MSLKAALPDPRARAPSPGPKGFVRPQKSLRMGNNSSLLTSAYVSLKIFHIFHPKVFLVTSLRDTPPPPLLCTWLCKNYCFPFAEINFHLKKVLSFITYDHGFKKELFTTPFYTNLPVNKVLLTLFQD